MPSHRLILDRTLAETVRAVAAVYGHSGLEHVQHGNRTRLSWPGGIWGSRCVWTLELEQGANGVLVHLDVVPSAGRFGRAGGRWGRAARQPFCSHRLTRLVTAVGAAPASSTRGH